MGLFDFLLGGKASDVERLPDRIWLTREVLHQSLAQEAVEQLENDGFVLVVTHFPSTFRSVSEALQARGVPIELVETEPLKPANMERIVRAGPTKQAWMTLATMLPDTEQETRDLPSPHPFKVLAAERHPLLEHDQRISTFAEELPVAAQLRMHMSLEDPLLRIFVMPQLKPILEKLGIKSDEVIESSLVGRHVTALQKKIAAQVTGDEPAESPEEWLEKNFPAELRPQA